MKNPGSTMRKRREWARCAALSLGCALLFLIPSPASRGDASVQQELPPDIVFATYPLIAGTESFGPVLADAISYRLISRGLAVRLEPGASSATELEAKAGDTGAAIALICRYSVAGSQMAISFLWNDIQVKAPPVVREGKGPLDLTLDSVILKALDDLLSEVHERVEELAAQRQAAVRARANPAAANEAARTAPPEVVTVVAPPAPDTTRLSLSSSFAPFLPVGPASSYFSVGFFPSLLVNLQFVTSAGRFALGLCAGMNFFSATGPLDSASSFLVPFGADIRYEIGNGAPFLAFAHVAGGPALLVLATGSQGTLTDVTAFVRSGIGFSLLLTPGLGISLAADYDVYFEMPYLIMGFSPTIMVTVVP